MTGVFAEDNDGFYGYVEDTHDPGYSLFFGTLLFCVVSFCSLPFFVTIGARLDVKNKQASPKKDKKRRKKQQKGVATNYNVVIEVCRDGADDEAETFYAEPPVTRLRKDLDNSVQQELQCPPSPSRSVISMGGRSSTFSLAAGSVCSAMTPSVGSSRSKRKKQRKKTRKRNMEKRHSLAEYELRMQQYDTYRSTEVVVVDKPAHKHQHTSFRLEDEQRSVLEPLDFDAVSLDDAVSAVELAFTRVKPMIQTKDDQEGEGFVDEDGGFWNTILDLVTWDFESKRLCKLAVPFATEALCEGVLETLTVAVIGKVLGTREVAAYVIVTSMVDISSSFFGGFIEALATLGAQALGHHKYKLVGQYVQLSVILYTMCSVPLIIVWWVYMKDILFWMGLDEFTCQIGHDYTKVYLFAELVEGIDEAVHELLDIQGLESYSTLIGVSHGVVAFLDVLLLVLVAKPELWVLGLMDLLVAIIFFGINVTVISWNGWFSKYREGLVGSCALYNKQALRQMLSTASSLAFGYLLTDGEVSISKCLYLCIRQRLF